MGPVEYNPSKPKLLTKVCGLVNPTALSLASVAVKALGYTHTCFKEGYSFISITRVSEMSRLSLKLSKLPSLLYVCIRIPWTIIQHKHMVRAVAWAGSPWMQHKIV